MSSNINKDKPGQKPQTKPGAPKGNAPIPPKKPGADYDKNKKK